MSLSCSLVGLVICLIMFDRAVYDDDLYDREVNRMEIILKGAGYLVALEPAWPGSSA